MGLTEWSSNFCEPIETRFEVKMDIHMDVKCKTEISLISALKGYFYRNYAHNWTYYKTDIVHVTVP